ncbi:MAG: DUF488 domain-containing protein [Halobacteriota archaeon]|nr:DUF488 domain-containing protein [Halobacteriota archaeon]
MTEDQATVYTIGHSNHDFDTFTQLIKGVDVVVDLRSNPYSKYVPHFNKRDLKRGLEAIGIDYVFIKEKGVGNILGGRPNDEECYRSNKISYEVVKGKEWYKRGILGLIDISKEKRTVIMCSEEDPYRCHRHNLITESLLERGFTVVHIRRDGRKEKVEKQEKKITILQTDIGQFV